MRQDNKKNRSSKQLSHQHTKWEESSHLWHFESMDRVNRALQGTNDLEQVMKDVLDTLLSVFECDRAWLVYPCDPDSPTWQVPMECTRPEYPGVLPIGVELPLDPVGAEVYRILRASDGPVKFGAGEEHLVPVEIATAFKVQSFIAMAFYPKIRKPWSFGLHQCSFARVWTPSEERLFQEIGRRLSDTLTSLLAYRDLQESEKQIKHLIDFSPVAMVVSSGPEEHVEWVNDKFIELFGYTVEDIPDVEHWWPLAYPDKAYRAEIKAQWNAKVEQAIREKGQIEPMEATVRCKDGSHRHVEFRLSSIGEKHLVAFVDLTERKRMEEALSASEAELRTLINAMTDIIFVGNSEGRYLKIVDTSPSLLYKPSKDLLGKTLHEVFPKDLADFFLNHLRQALNTQKSVNFEYSLPIGEKELWFYATVSPMTDDKILMVARDITDRKRAEKALRESEEKYRTLIQKIQAAVIVHGSDTRILTSNSMAQELLGLTEEQMLGKTAIDTSWHFFLEDGTRMPIEKYPVNQVLASRKALRNFTAGVHRPNNENDVWVLVNADPVFGEEDTITHVIVTFINITERKQAEEALRKSEQRYHGLFEDSSISIWEEDFSLLKQRLDLLRQEGVKDFAAYFNDHPELLTEYASQIKVVDINKATLKMFEARTKSELLENVAQVIKNDDFGIFREELVKIANGELDFQWEEPNQTLAGNQIHILFRWTVVPGFEDTLSRVIISITDITQRKQMEEALRESEWRYREVFDNVLDSLYLLEVTEDGRFRNLEINPAFEKSTGLSRTQLIGKFIEETVPEEAASVVNAKYRRCVEAHHPIEEEVELDLPAGRRYFYSTLIPARDETGRVHRVIGISRDITEHKQAEEALRESEERYRQLVDLSPDSIAVYSQGRIVFANPATVRMAGAKSEEDLIGKSVLDFIHPDFRAAIKTLMDEVQSTGKPIPFVEETFLRLDGSSVDVEVAVVPYSSQGVQYTQIVARDITERKRHELEREAIITVSTALRKATTRTEILTVILDQLVELFDADGAMIALPNPETRDTIIEMGHGIVGERFTGLRIPQGKGVSGWVIANKKPYLNNDADVDSLFYRPDLLGDSHCVASVPLIAQEHAIGALWIARHMSIMEQELRLLNAIADIAANAIHRVMLHEQTVQQLHHLLALHQIDLAISANFDLNVMLSVILKNVKDELEVDAASILLLDPVTHTLNYAAGIGFRARGIEASHVKLGHGNAGRAAQEYRTVSWPDLNQAPGTFSRSSLLADDEFLSHYATPLVVKGQAKGVLEIFHRKVLESRQEWIDYFETLATQTAIAIESASLFESLQRSNQELVLAYDATIEGWSRALDLRDRETEGHTQRVTEMVLDLAEKMGMSHAEKIDIRRGALLHDIGKMGVPDSILLKPGSLSESEQEVMQQHPLYAFQMLSPITYLKHALDIPYCHHEKWDGSGYPRGLKEDEIPLSARMFAIVDVLDALTSNRPYREAWSSERTFQYIKEQAGRHFDPQIVRIFFETR